MSLLRNYLNINLLIYIILLLSHTSFAQDDQEWINVHLIDTVNYTGFSSNESNNRIYPPSNLFDGQLHTCWVSESSSQNSSLFVKLTTTEPVIHIFAGYGKNNRLYYANSRPKKLRITPLYGINPDGFVSENGALYKSLKSTYSQEVELLDSFGVQSINLKYEHSAIQNLRKYAWLFYKNHFEVPVADSGLILQIEIIETTMGNKYDDVCISELFFSDRLVSQNQPKNIVSDIYLNDQENTLFIKDTENKEIQIYRDTSSVLQLMESSENKKWAILVEMPASIEGRAETNYLLVDLVNRELVNSKLEKYNPNFLSGSMIYFEKGRGDQLLLNYTSKLGDYEQIELW